MDDSLRVSIAQNGEAAPEAGAAFFLRGSRPMRVIVNGEPREIGDDITVAGLLKEMQITLQYGAVAVNRQVVRKKDHEAARLKAGDRIEIVRPVGGG
jgi:thiamine biosynthesis protein ThiS